MVVNNHLWEEQTRKYLAEAQSELKTIDAEIKELQDKSIMLTRAVDAYETALQDYLRRTGRQETASYDWVKLLSSPELTHKKRLIEIAKQMVAK